MNLNIRITKDEVRKWLKKNSNERVLRDPIGKAENDGLCGKAVERFLKTLEEEGLIKMFFCFECTGGRGRPRKKIDHVEFNDFEEKKNKVVLKKKSVGDVIIDTGSGECVAIDSSALSKAAGGKISNEDEENGVTVEVGDASGAPVPAPLKKDGVVVIFDYDNTSLCSIQKRGKEIDIPSMYDAIMRYAGGLGVVLKKEAFITTRTEERDFVVMNFFSLDRTPVVIVPPEKDAADGKMIESIEFSIMVPRMKAVIIVSDDSKAFGPLCEKIKEAGCETHIVTTGFASPALARAATRIISIFDLMRRAGITESQISSHQRDRFHNAARYISQGLDPVSNEEKFIVACLDMVRTLTRKPGSWLNFHRLYENTWMHMEESARGRFGLDDCRCALEALIQAQLVKKSSFSFGGRGSMGYFAR